LPINNGDGTFSEVVDLPSGASYVESVGIADIMNNDCMIDIVVGKWGQKNNQLLINTGDGNFHNLALEYWQKRQKRNDKSRVLLNPPKYSKVTNTNF
jgi:hypothetical protein